jgi:hypothetical protein
MKPLIQKVLALVVIIGGALVIIKYLVPYLGAFSSLAAVIVALVAIVAALYVIIGDKLNF